jgi:fructose-1,6-bisphosphatase I
VLYGSSTVMVLTIGTGVDMFVLDPSIGAFIRVAEGMKIPPRQKCYSLNEGNRLSMPGGYQQYLHWAQDNGYSSRYIGAMVADVHRILIQGGVFLYPPTKKAPKGKLRLMYEANPMAMLVGPGERILDVRPTEIHQRTTVVLGSADEVDQVMTHL